MVLVGVLSIGAYAQAEYVDTLVDTGNANTNAVNLQAAIDAAAARPGETRIVLPAAATFCRTTAATPIILRKKTVTNDNAYCTIESSAIASLPAGQRVTPAQENLMPNVLTRGNNEAVIKTEAGAHHYRIRGLEISATADDNADILTSMVTLGTDLTTQSTVESVPHHIDIDRCYIHQNLQNPDEHHVKRMISLHSGLTTITNCHISGAHHASAEVQAINGYNGTGPYFIINNYIEGATENIMMGGGSCRLPEVPSDVTFKRNYLAKPETWRGVYAVKNIFEIKFGKRYDIQGNRFERTWADGQDAAIVIKVDSNNLSANTDAKTKTEDIYFANNHIKSAPTAFNLQGRDWSAGRAPALDRVTIYNNLCEDISRVTWGHTSIFAGSFTYVNNGAKNVVIDHNTVFQDRYALSFDGTTYTSPGFIYRNNVVKRNNAWNPDADVYHSAGSYGSAALAQGTGTNGYTFLKNALVFPSANIFNATDTANNFWPASFGGVLVDQPNGNYNVVAGSVYDNGGTDGKDVGADVAQLNYHTAGALNGVWNSKDIVLRAAEATTIVGPWAVQADSGASDGYCLKETDNAIPKVTDPSATPASYFEVTFQATAGVEYHLWIRGKAPSNNTSSDSVHVQFNNTVDAAGNPAWRIGTGGPGKSIEWVLQNGSNPISGWGWRDSKWSTTVAEKRVKFATSGTQTIRLQRREDGVSIDQIVLSPATYMGRGSLVITPGEPKYGPGTETNDTTTLAKQ
jgi:hypothetical protein